MHTHTDPIDKDTNIQAGWLAYLDLFGFGAELSSTNLSAINARVLRLARAVDVIQEKNPEFKTFMYSDSLIAFVACPANRHRTTTIEFLADCIRQTQVAAAEEDLVYRGAIAFGKVTFGARACIGEPVLRAVRLEQRLAIPIVVLPEVEIDRANDDFWRQWAPMEIPTKFGLMYGTPILPRPLDALIQHAEECRKKTLTDGPEDVAKTWSTFCTFVTKVMGD